MGDRGDFTDLVSSVIKSKLEKEATNIPAERMEDYTAGLKAGVDLVLKLTSSANHGSSGFKIYPVEMVQIVGTEPIQMYNHDRSIGAPVVTLMDELWNKVSS